ncbi:MAG: phenylalanine--tRNA ligase subunit beta [Gammaproteobacteria bacterium]|nr:phenylalanine--tRNA ligase subunit beta [Gammaproteobacteria bacterium]
MKFAQSWLREWVEPKISTEDLAHRLTMAGHEVESVIVEGEGLDGVVVAEVLAVSKHPDADRLNVCSVSTGTGEPVDVVCGAPNVFTGMKSPLAVPGVKLPNGLKLRKSKIRGVVSNGMLCSAIELGLGDESDGIVELAADAPVGTPLSDYLGLPDAIIDLDLTPNRGDCFSVLGIARDVAALTGQPLQGPERSAVAATIDDKYPVECPVPAACPRFVGRVIKDIDLAAKSPAWMTERLRKSGIRAIHVVVDVTNYVMMELGQPLHAYDLGQLQGSIRPRYARSGEKVTLLDSREVGLTEDTVVIADDSGAIGMAGIMGGLSTAVTERTTDVFLEAAFWPPEIMAGRARSYAMHTDASLRFERGVDPAGQGRAIERASELLLAIAGGQAGPLVEQVSEEHLPARNPVTLTRARLDKVLGTEIPAATVSDILSGLGLDSVQVNGDWQVSPPSFRFDIAMEDDLVEEVARIYGYDRIPEATGSANLPLGSVTETRIDLELVADTLVARDYQEVITYSFIDADSNETVTGKATELVLSNPISSEMSVMRGSLLPGMLAAAAMNVSRQQERVRLFEIGKSFHGTLETPVEVVRVAFLALGPGTREQWATKSQDTEFYDLKGDLEALIQMTGSTSEFDFVVTDHAALQPGQAAEIKRNGEVVGIIGKLHPRVAKSFELKKAVFVVEIDAHKMFVSSAPVAQSVSRFPTIRRDIAVIVDEDIAAAQLVRAVESAAPDLVREVTVFDVYRGPGIEAGRKSIALGLILQETSRTLTDEDADTAMNAAVQKLEQEFAAVLRD